MLKVEDEVCSRGLIFPLINYSRDTALPIGVNLRDRCRLGPRYVPQGCAWSQTQGIKVWCWVSLRSTQPTRRYQTRSRPYSEKGCQKTGCRDKKRLAFPEASQVKKNSVVFSLRGNPNECSQAEHACREVLISSSEEILPVKRKISGQKNIVILG
jgi:hypothetical protein